METPARCASVVILAAVPTDDVCASHLAVTSVFSGAPRWSSLRLHCYALMAAPACRHSMTPAASPTSRAHTEVCTRRWVDRHRLNLTKAAT